MLPVQAVGSAAGAVGGIADSGLVVGMTRGRLWIAVLGVLLGGIVALNVLGLSLSASTSGAATQIDELERANTVLRGKIAERGSGNRVQALAASLGLQTPTPKDVRYLKATPKDIAAAVSVLDGLAIAPELAAAAEPAPAAAGAGTAVAVPAESESGEPATPIEPGAELASSATEPAGTDAAPAPTSSQTPDASAPADGGVAP
jgi:hypothetical protein